MTTTAVTDAATLPSLNRVTLASQILAGIALYGILSLHLLSALLAGLLMHHLVQATVPLLGRVGIKPTLSKVIALIAVAGTLITLVVLGVLAATPHVQDGSESTAALMQKMADVVDRARSYLPALLQEHLPTTLEELQDSVATWLRNNAVQLSYIGKTLGISLVHIVIGLVIGGMVAFNHKTQDIAYKPKLTKQFFQPSQSSKPPLVQALTERADLLQRSFDRIVFSQVRISALNTVLTGLFLVFMMPMIGNPLPFTKTMIAITFFVGLLPVIGNLISCTAIFLIALSVSLVDAIAALVFLVVIHKLEYFLNARIIGSRISAHAWELLLAMLVMEACFGIPGLIAAPIYYAYLKDELAEKGLV